MKKILFTLVNLNIGGVQKSLLNILNNIDYGKYSVDLMLLEKGGEWEKTLPKNIRILYLSDFVNLNIKKGFIYRFKKNISIRSILSKYKKLNTLSYDYAVSFYGFDNYADLISVAVNAKKRVIWIHNDYYNMVNNSNHKNAYRLMYKLMGRKFNFFDTIVAVCEGVKDTFNIFYNNKYDDKIKIVNNVIDDSEILKKANEVSNVKLDGNFNIISVGRLCRAKNFKDLISLHELLIKDGYKIKTYVIGYGECYEDLKKLIIQKNIDDSFILIGSNSNPYNIMKQADLFVSTSLYETFGITMIESLILGIPVISSNTIGAQNIIKNIANTDSMFIGGDINHIYKLVESAIIDKLSINKLSLNEYNKKVMKSFYNLLS